MRDYTWKEKARITAGAVAALIIEAWLDRGMACRCGIRAAVSVIDKLATFTELCSTPRTATGTLFYSGELRKYG
jgi:hypothetical protein